VAAFTAVLLMALGTDTSIGREHASTLHAIASADMVAAFRYVFAAAAALMGIAALCMMLMEQRPLAGPAKPAMDMAE
jgi:hypothetical protein